MTVYFIIKHNYFCNILSQMFTPEYDHENKVNLVTITATHIQKDVFSHFVTSHTIFRPLHMLDWLVD